MYVKTHSRDNTPRDGYLHTARGLRTDVMYDNRRRKKVREYSICFCRAIGYSAAAGHAVHSAVGAGAGGGHLGGGMLRMSASV